MRIVSWFSCGAASAVATKLALVENRGRLPFVVARCVVAEEHPDNDRFAKDCERWFGVPIINLINEKYNGSIYEVFNKTSYISGVKGAPCTRLLKKEVRTNFELPTDKHMFGYCADEEPRWDRFLDANNIDARSPLIEQGITHADCLLLLKKAGIRVPKMYELGYKHNNCIGCCKATGPGYWNKIKKDFPEMFTRMDIESRRLGVRLVRLGEVRMFLNQLPADIGNYKDEPESQCGPFCQAADATINRVAK